MRTTVEIKAEQRAKLLELAARRGEKGFSTLIQEAIDLYLAGQRGEEAVERAKALQGFLRPEEADELEADTRRIRGQWR
jgi:hypothetical protein